MKGAQPIDEEQRGQRRWVLSESQVDLKQTLKQKRRTTS